MSKEPTACIFRLLIIYIYIYIYIHIYIHIHTYTQGNGENYIMRNLVICTPYPTLCGW